MSESEKTATDGLWEKTVIFCRGMLTNEAERSKMERFFPQFLSHVLVGNEYRIGVSGETEVEWFTPLYANLIAKALVAAGAPADVTVKFVVVAVPDATNRVAAQPYGAALHSAALKTAASNAGARTTAFSSTLPLDPLYTFENFVRGPSNSFAYAAATAVAKSPGKNNYNPLFLYGGTGLGKTHLMEAIGSRILQLYPSKSVCYITSETFLNKYVEALANGSVQEFRTRYRNVDVLLIDDVQFIAGKDRIQEEFFNTFQELMIYNKQVVLTSDVPPKDLAGLESRLIGRFQQGMVVEIEAPSYETRLAILIVKAKALNVAVPQAALQWIAENIRSHVRAIEGALSLVATFIESNPNLELTNEVLNHLLRNLIEEEKIIRNLTVNEIIEKTAAYYGVTVAAILSPERTQPLVTARQLAMYLACKLTTCSLPAIGKAFGKNHSTVHHGSINIKRRIDVEPELGTALEAITVQLGRKVSDVRE